MLHIRHQIMEAIEIQNELSLIFIINNINFQADYINQIDRSVSDTNLRTMVYNIVRLSEILVSQESEVSLTPTEIIERFATLTDESDECHICMEKPITYKLKCSHTYCQDCLVATYKHTKCCAYCRQKF